jgi:hypothetical protein
VAQIVSLEVADPPGRWSDLGFAVEGTCCRVGDVVVELGAAGRGVVSWIVGDAGALPELPTGGGPGPGRSATASGPAGPAAPHPNGVTALDHVVVTTPDLARTVAAVEAAGIELRRRRDFGTAEDPRVQAFFRLGPTILEVVGPAMAVGAGPARFWGLAFVVADLRTTASVLGARLQPVVDAVQPGRKIATLDHSAGSTVPMAFLSPPPGSAHR